MQLIGEIKAVNTSDGYYNLVVVDKNGDIFNLDGVKMTPSIDRCGYLHGSINGRNCSYHRIIAECFIPNPYGSKLDDESVRYIRKSDKSSYKLAKELEVDSSTIRDVRNNKTWRHVL